MGDGAADQLQHHLYDGYDAEDPGHSGAGGVRVCAGVCDRDVCIYQAYFFQEIIFILLTAVYN